MENVNDIIVMEYLIMDTTRRSSYVPEVNLEHALHQDITEWSSENSATDITMLSVMNLDQDSNEERTSENPEVNITMLSVMSTSSNDPEIRNESASNDPEIRNESFMSLGTEMSDRSMRSISSESSVDSQVAVQIYKELKKLKLKLMRRRALNNQVSQV